MSTMQNELGYCLAETQVPTSDIKEFNYYAEYLVYHLAPWRPALWHDSVWSKQHTSYM